MMTTFLDVLPRPRPNNPHPRPNNPHPRTNEHPNVTPAQHENTDGESEWTVDVPVGIESDPLLDASQGPVEGEAVAALAVALLLGAALFAMNKLQLVRH